VIIKERVQVPGTAERVWELLWDVPRIAKCIPGCLQTRTVIPGKKYKAVVEQRVGQFKARFNLDITIASVEEPRRLVASARGQDVITKSFTSADLTVELEPQGVDAVSLNVAVDMKLLGKLATLGQTMVERKSEEVVREFAGAMGRELGAVESSE
jgi:uncharacterized protein